MTVCSHLWQKGVQEVPAGVPLEGRGVFSGLLPSGPHWGIGNAANHQHPSLFLAAELSAILQAGSLLVWFAWHNLLQTAGCFAWHNLLLTAGYLGHQQTNYWLELQARRFGMIIGKMIIFTLSR